MDTLSDIQGKVYDQLMQMSVKDAVGCFLDYHGWQLITKSFAEHLVDEGYCDASDVGIEDTYADAAGYENV